MANTPKNLAGKEPSKLNAILYISSNQKGEAMQPNSNVTQNVGDELLSDAKGIGSAAVNRLHSEVDARKSDAVTQVEAVSSTFERAAENLDENAPDWIKSALEQGAQKVKTFAETLEQKDSRQIVGQINAFATRSPVTFLGACAAAGFAAARIFNAGSKTETLNQFGAESTEQPDAQPSQHGSPVKSDLGSNSQMEI